MKIHSTVKKALIVSTMVAPLVLASCGKDDKGDSKEKETTTVATSTKTSTVETESSTEETSTDATSTEETSTDATSTETTTDDSDVVKDPAAERLKTMTEEPSTSVSTSVSTITSSVAAAAPARTVPTTLNIKQPQEIADGQAASASQKAAIENSFKSYTGFFNKSGDKKQRIVAMMQNTCSDMFKKKIPNFDKQQYINQLNNLPPQMFNQLMNNPAIAPTFNELETAQAPDKVTVDDVRVKGNKATAKVTTVTGGKATTLVMPFEQEGGQWTICPPVE